MFSTTFRVVKKNQGMITRNCDYKVPGLQSLSGDRQCKILG